MAFDIETVPALISNPVLPMNSPPVTVNVLVDGKNIAADVFEVYFPPSISIVAPDLCPFPLIAEYPAEISTYPVDLICE